MIGRRFVGACAAALVLFAPRLALADARAEARRYFESGMAHIGEGRFDQGIGELERAYEILPHPSVRYNIARAYDEAGKNEQALAAYEEYLESDPPDRVEVEASMKALRERIAEAKAPKPPPPPDDGAPPPPPPPPAPPPPRKPAEADLYEETVVTASRRAQSPLDAPSSTTVITRQDIRLSGITRIPELLRRVAGMDVMQITGGDSNVSIRGLNSRLSNKLLVLVNGRSLKNDILGSTFWESLSIDVDQIERIEVVRGPGSSLYGADAFAGVVNIITIAPGEGGVGARVGYGDHEQAYGSLWASGRDGDFAFRGSAGYTRYPRWTREVDPARVDLHQADVDQNVGAQSFRADVRASRRVGEGKALELGGGFTRGTLDIYGIGPFNDYFVEADQGDASAAFHSELVAVRSNYTFLSATASQNHDYLGHTLYETDPFQHSFETDVELTPVFSFPSALSHALVTGVGYRLKKINWNYLLDEPPIEHHVGLFLQDAVSFAERHTLVVSGRLDYVPALERLVPSVRGSYIVKPTPAQAIRAAVATAFRSPTFLESYLDLPIQLTLAGVELESSSKRADDPEFLLEPEQILAAELGYSNQQIDDWQFDVAGYYHRVSDLIVLADPRLLTLSNAASGIGGLDPATGQYLVAFGGWTNQCSIDHVFGGEVGARWYGIEGLDVFANYAIQYGMQELPPGCAVPQDERTSHHKVNVGTQLRTSFGLEGEITFHWQSEQVWGEQIATLSGIEYRLFDLPSYHLLNGRVGYNFWFERRLNVAATVYNALSGVFDEAPQQHPFGNRVGRRVMGFLSYQL